MAVPVGNKGLRCGFESTTMKESNMLTKNKLTNLESHHRQGVDTTRIIFGDTKQKDQQWSNTIFTPNPVIKKKDGGFSNGFSNGSKNTTKQTKSGVATSTSSTCFCGKDHAGGRANCAMFC